VINEDEEITYEEEELCMCGLQECVAHHTYVCPRCDRTLHWSNGCADDTPALCDECAVVIQTGVWNPFPPPPQLSFTYAEKSP
jgi:hypothetical protein